MRSGGNATFGAIPVAIGLAAILLAGCSASSAPKHSASPTPTSALVSSTPVPTTSAATTAAPGPPKITKPTVPADVPKTGPNIKQGEKPPVMPLEATQHTARGAKAFAEFFIKTIDWGFATVSSTYLAHYSAPGCVSCNSLIKSISSDQRGRHRYLGGRFKIVKAGAGGDAAKVIVTVDGTAFEELDAKGKFVSGDPAKRIRFEVIARWSGRGWEASALDVLT
jgi:hypothetical protein